MSQTCHEEIGRVGRVGRGCYENPREDVRDKSLVSGKSPDTPDILARIGRASARRCFRGVPAYTVRCGGRRTAAGTWARWLCRRCLSAPWLCRRCSNARVRRATRTSRRRRRADWNSRRRCWSSRASPSRRTFTRQPTVTFPRPRRRTASPAETAFTPKHNATTVRTDVAWTQFNAIYSLLSYPDPDPDPEWCHNCITLRSHHRIIGLRFCPYYT